MPSRFIQFLFTLTSLAPMCLVYATLFSFDSDPLLSLTTNRWKAIGCLVLMFILVGTCLAVLRFYSKKVKQRSLEIHSLKPVDQPAIGFVVAYLLPVAFVDPSDVTNAVRYLVSDDARWVTGTSLKVDAGATANPPGNWRGIN